MQTSASGSGCADAAPHDPELDLIRLVATLWPTHQDPGICCKIACPQCAVCLAQGFQCPQLAAALLPWPCNAIFTTACWDPTQYNSDINHKERGTDAFLQQLEHIVSTHGKKKFTNLDPTTKKKRQAPTIEFESPFLSTKSEAQRWGKDRCGPFFIFGMSCLRYCVADMGMCNCCVGQRVPPEEFGGATHVTNFGIGVCVCCVGGQRTRAQRLDARKRTQMALYLRAKKQEMELWREESEDDSRGRLAPLEATPACNARYLAERGDALYEKLMAHAERRLRRVEEKKLLSGWQPE